MTDLSYNICKIIIDFNMGRRLTCPAILIIVY